MLALMTALYGDQDTRLIGVEEPENYIHPSALSSFVLHVLDALDRVQFVVTTHSPLLLDFLNEPEAMIVVKRDNQKGTVVSSENDPEGGTARFGGVGLWPWRSTTKPRALELRVSGEVRCSHSFRGD